MQQNQVLNTACSAGFRSVVSQSSRRSTPACVEQPTVSNGGINHCSTHEEKLFPLLLRGLPSDWLSASSKYSKDVSCSYGAD
eukprot:1998797-Amphidinium_carterae.1